jgi:integrase
MKKQKKLEEKYLESDELKTLISSMTVPKWRFLAELTALSGMRIGEAIALNSSDVDFNPRIIKVTKTYDPVNRIAEPPKTSASNREIQMQDELYRLCKRINLYMKKERLTLGYASDLFINDINGNHVNYYSYNAYLSENAERLFNKKVTSHFIRHTHVALMAEQGIPIEVISRRLGHTNSKITLDIYFHATKKMKEKDMEQVKEITIL